jgi:hypothetical protein
MRRFARIVVLAALFIGGASPAGAAVITLGSLPGLGSFAFDGELDAGEDIALLTFTLTEDTLFDVRTTSFSDPSAFGFDPYFALFRNGSLFERQDPADGGTYLSISGDIDLGGGDYDDRLMLTLTQGSYTLALLQYTNELRSFDLLDSDPWLDVAFVGDPSCPFGDFDGCRSGRFGMSVTLASAAPPPASVPEPATLTLFGLGLAGAALGRSRRRRQEPSSH